MFMELFSYPSIRFNLELFHHFIRSHFPLSHNFLIPVFHPCPKLYSATKSAFPGSFSFACT